jgi:hypothetical protein
MSEAQGKKVDAEIAQLIAKTAEINNSCSSGFICRYWCSSKVYFIKKC